MNIVKFAEFSKGNVPKSLQGMSVYGDKIFQLYHLGYCNVFDFTEGTHEPLCSFMLGSASDHNHANNCNFSSIHYNGNKIPLLYVVDGNSGEEMRCSVENITEDNGVYKSEKVQEINLDQSSFEEAGYMKYWGWPSWIIEPTSNRLYLHGAKYRTNGSMDEYWNDNRYIISEVRLPKIEEGNVILTADDVISQFTTEYNVNFTQGGTANGKYLFYTYGTGKENRPSAIRAWDLEKRILLPDIDVSEIHEEIEDCHICDGKLYFITQKQNMYCIDMDELTL